MIKNDNLPFYKLAHIHNVSSYEFLDEVELKQFKKNIPSGTHTTYSEDGSVLNVVEYSENGEVLSVNGNPLPVPDEGL